MLLTALSEVGNIHGAAEALNMSQPAASKLLKDLEDKLGVALFERQPRGMRPNWYGEIMIRHSRNALSSLREAGQEFDAVKSGRAGHVSVGAITGPALTLLPPAIANVTRENPNLRIVLQVESSDVLLDHLARGELDIVIGRLFENADKVDFRYERLAQEPVCAVVRRSHPLLDVPRLKLAALEKKSWIVPPPGSVLRQRFDLMFREAGLNPPTQLIETSSLLFVTKMLEQTDFIAVLSQDVARYYGGFGLVRRLPIELSCTMDAFGIITRRDWLLSPAANLLLQALKESAATNYGCEFGRED